MQLWRRLREDKRSSEDQKCGEVQVSTFRALVKRFSLYAVATRNFEVGAEDIKWLIVCQTSV